MAWLVFSVFASWSACAEPEVQHQNVAGRLYASDHVVDVKIRVDPEDWDQLRQQTRSLMGSLADDGERDTPFDYVKADVTIDGVLIKQVGIRKKGFLGSLDLQRPSLKIKFDKYRDQAPFGVIDRLTLNNNKQDPSRLSQYLSYGFFNQTGTFASRCNYAKVTVNDQYLGIYSNVEPIETPMLARGFGDGSGMLFEGTVADFVPDLLNRFELKTKESKRTQLAQLAELLAADTLDLTAIESLIDIDVFLRFWATESLIGFWDGYTHNQNNFFMYINPIDTKIHFLPWGTDSAFTNTVPPVIDKILHRSFHSNAVLANRLYHDRRTRQRYRAALEDLLANHWQEDKLIAEIDRVEQMLNPQVLDRDQFAAAIENVRRFVRKRRSVLTQELKAWPIPIHFGPRRPGHAKEIGAVSATFQTQWPAARSKPSVGNVEIEMTLDGEPVVFREIGVTAEMGKHSQVMIKDGADTPTLTFKGIRDSDGTELTISLKFNPDDFQPGKQAVAVNGLFMEGSLVTFFTMLAFNPAAIKMVDGSAVLNEAGMQSGDPISGETKIRILTFAGGEKPKRSWQE